MGLAWAGGLVLLMVAVFFYGLSVYEPERFEVRWTDTEHETSQSGATLNADQSRTHTFEADGTNVTRVRVVLGWTDAVGPDNDVFSLEVAGPGDRSNTATGNTGALTLTFMTDRVPDQTQVEGANAEHALEQLVRPDDLWSGLATWEVMVRLDSATGDAGTQGLGVDATADQGNDYTLRFIRVTSDATLVPV